MDTNYKICCFTGHQPGGFPWDYYDKNCAEHQEYLTAMRDIVLKLIRQLKTDIRFSIHSLVL